VDEEEGKSSGVLGKFFTSSAKEESPGKERLKIGEDRIFNKPVKVFTNEGGMIKRDIVERDTLNVFETVKQSSSSKRIKSG